MANKKQTKPVSKIVDVFLNPFDDGVVYTAFVKRVNEQKKTVAEYCRGELTRDQMDFLERDLKLTKLKINKK